MTPSPADARRWTEHGTELLVDAVTGMEEAAFARRSLLPGWTRAHVVAHVAANAEALGNLVHWAASGEPTPMYVSREQRDADIEAGARLGPSELVGWLRRSAAALSEAMDALADERWSHEVVTASGRGVPAAEIPWMRAREVMVHTVDLDAGVGFADLPQDILVSLCADIAARRSAQADGPALILRATDVGSSTTVAGSGGEVALAGPLAAVVSYLAGRGGDGVASADGTPVPELPVWL